MPILAVWLSVLLGATVPTVARSTPQVRAVRVGTSSATFTSAPRPGSTVVVVVGGARDDNAPLVLTAAQVSDSLGNPYELLAESPAETSITNASTWWARSYVFMAKQVVSADPFVVTVRPAVPAATVLEWGALEIIGLEDGVAPTVVSAGSGDEAQLALALDAGAPFATAALGLFVGAGNPVANNANLRAPDFWSTPFVNETGSASVGLVASFRLFTAPTPVTFNFTYGTPSDTGMTGVLVALPIASSTPVSQTPTLVQSAPGLYDYAVVGASVTSFATPVTAGNAIVVGVASHDGCGADYSPPLVRDDHGNTYTVVATGKNVASDDANVFVATGVAGGTVTVSVLPWAPLCMAYSWAAFEVAGLGDFVAADLARAGAASGVITDPMTVTFSTTTQTNQLGVGLLSHYNCSFPWAFSAPGWTRMSSVAEGSPTDPAMNLVAESFPSAGSVNLTWSMQNSCGGAQYSATLVLLRSEGRFVGVVRDAGISDSGISDSGISDSGIGDSGIGDSGIGDSGIGDSGISDSGDAGFGTGGDSGVGDGGTPLASRDYRVACGCQHTDLAPFSRVCGHCGCGDFVGDRPIAATTARIHSSFPGIQAFGSAQVTAAQAPGV